MQLCDYGCGKEGKFLFNNGKWCCSDSTNKCRPPGIKCPFCQTEFTKRSISIHTRRCLYNPLNVDKLQKYEEQKNILHGKCKGCGKKHDGLYGSGKFCSERCARRFATKNNNNTVKLTKSGICTLCNADVTVGKRATRNKIICINCKIKKIQEDYISKNNITKPIKFRGNNWHPMTQSRHGLSKDQYDNMKKSQNGKCKICQCDLNVCNVDHCHKSGKIRGMLCPRCNSGLGLFKDDISLLQKAIEYLNSTL